MTRQEFLETQWNPYPTLPSGAAVWGRFLGLASERKILLWRNGESVSVPVAAGAGADELLKILIPGDLVAVLEDQKTILLAPWMTTGIFTPLDERPIRLLNQVRRGLRDFFENQGFLEVPTPTLVACPGTEPSLEAFETEWIDGSRREKKYLPTSPELHLKKALARGFEKIFEIKNVFRNGEITSAHQPEFTMIEWYRAGENLDSIARDVRALVDFLAVSLAAESSRKPREVREVSMAELFRSAVGFTLTPGTTHTEYLKLAQGLGLRVSAADSIDDLFFLIFTEKIEAGFDPDVMMIVKDWPPFQAALARIGHSGWAERFEVYWQGLELANAFHELNDPEAQSRRFAEDLEKKVRMGKRPITLDPEFQQALESGMPPSAGIALGVDRLTMALFGFREIAELRAFPARR